MDVNAMGMDPCDNKNSAIFNTTTQQRTHVDSRTGLLEAKIVLPSIVGNAGMGPAVDMSLYYSPVVNNLAALGDGWSFAFTTWFESAATLVLHTGEPLSVKSKENLRTRAVVAEWTPDGTELQVTRADGRFEVLKQAGTSKIWTPIRIRSDGYRKLDLTWTVVEQTGPNNARLHQVCLTQIEDDDRTLISVDYGSVENKPDIIKLTYWPGSDEQLVFTLKLEDYALKSVTMPEGTATELTYQRHETCGWLLTKIVDDKGMTDTVKYGVNPISLPNEKKLNALPRVESYTRLTRKDATPLVETFEYQYEGRDTASGRRKFSKETQKDRYNRSRVKTAPNDSKQWSSLLQKTDADLGRPVYTKIDDTSDLGYVWPYIVRRTIGTRTTELRFDADHRMTQERAIAGKAAIVKNYWTKGLDKESLIKAASTEWGEAKRRDDAKTDLHGGIGDFHDYDRFDDLSYYDPQVTLSPNELAAQLAELNRKDGPRYDVTAGRTEEDDYTFIDKGNLCLKLERGSFTYIDQSLPAATTFKKYFPEVFLASLVESKVDRPDKFGHGYARWELVGSLPRGSQLIEGNDAKDFPIQKRSDALDFAQNRIKAIKRPHVAKAVSYVAIDGLNRAKPCRRYTAMQLGKKGQVIYNLEEIEYFTADDFRKGKPSLTRRGSCDPATGTFVAKTVVTTNHSYELDAGKKALTETMSETRGGITRTRSETRSVLSGRLISQTDANGNTNTFAYDAYGRLVEQVRCAQSTDDAYRQATTFTYPSPCRVEIAEQDGSRRAIVTDGRGELVAEYGWDAAKATWRPSKTIDYDRYGRKQVTTLIDRTAAGADVIEREQIVYDDWGHEWSKSGPDGIMVFNEYDPVMLKRREWVGAAKDLHGRCTTYADDGTTKNITWLNRKGKVYQKETYTYNDSGKVQTMIQDGLHGKRSIRYEYDAVGRIKTEDHEGDGRKYTYTNSYPLDRSIEHISSIVYSDDSGTRSLLGSRDFDACGRVTQLTRAGVRNTYRYTEGNTEPETRTLGDGTKLNYTYIRELGNKVETISDVDGKNRKVFTYASGRQRVSTSTEGSAMVKGTHDADDRVVESDSLTSDGLKTEVKSVHSPSGRLESYIDAPNAKTTFTYDKAGRRTGAKTPKATTQTTYGTNGRIASEQVKCGSDVLSITYAYDDSSIETVRRFQLASKKLDISFKRSYFDDGRLESVEILDGAASKGKRKYAYGAAGRLSRCESEGEYRPANPKGKKIEIEEIVHDGLGRVATLTTTFRAEGSKTTETCTSTYVPDPAKGMRLKQVKHSHADYKSGTLTYDNNGRVVKDENGTCYSYDWLGRLIQVGSRRYTYDPNDRIATTTGADGVQKRVVYAGMKVRGEYASDGTGRDLKPGTAACTVQNVRLGKVERTMFELRDAEGTVLVSYDATAKTLKYHAYTAYGAHTSTEDQSLLGFKGEYRDADNDRYMLGQGYRCYDPARMCFHAPDDMSPFDKGGAHAYAYCSGDPTNGSDPTGHWDWGLVPPPPPPPKDKFPAFLNVFLWAGLGIITAVGALGAVLAAPVTGGTSLAVYAAVATAAFGVVMSVAAFGTAMAAVFVEDSDPAAAQILNWVSFGATVMVGSLQILNSIRLLVLRLGRTVLSVAKTMAYRARDGLARVIPAAFRGGRQSASAMYRAGSASGFRTAAQVEYSLAPVALDAVDDVPVFEQFAYYESVAATKSGNSVSVLSKAFWWTVDSLNDIVCISTGVLNNIAYFQSVTDAFVSANVNNMTWFPWNHLQHTPNQYGEPPFRTFFRALRR